MKSIFLSLVLCLGFFPLNSIAENSQRSKALKHLRKISLSRDIRIKSIVAYDQGNISESASTDTTLDTFQETCSDDSDEPFFDTVVGIELSNNRTVPIQIRKIAYVVFKATDAGKKFRARKYAPLGGNEVAAESSGRITGLFLDTEGDRKYFAGAEDPITVDLGFRNVKFRVVGIDLANKRFRVRQKVAFSFGNPDRCS